MPYLLFLYAFKYLIYIMVYGLIVIKSYPDYADQQGRLTVFIEQLTFDLST